MNYGPRVSSFKNGVMIRVHRTVLNVYARMRSIGNKLIIILANTKAMWSHRPPNHPHLMEDSLGPVVSDHDDPRQSIEMK